MVSKFYIERKINSVSDSVPYIANKLSPKACADLMFLTGTLKGAIENASHRCDDMQYFPECRALIFRLLMILRNKFIKIRESNDNSEVDNDVRWCLECLGCIITELKITNQELQGIYTDFSIEETHASLMTPEDSDAVPNNSEPEIIDGRDFDEPYATEL